jgi:hypothetical protein
MTLPNVSGLFYKIGFAVALLSAGLVAKHDYDGRVAAAAVLAERIKADSVVLADLNETIAARNDAVVHFVGIAQKAEAKARVDSAATSKAKASVDSLRAHLDTTSIEQLKTYARELEDANDKLWSENNDLRIWHSQRDSVDQARDAREAAKDEKIAALDRLNKNIATAVAPTHHLRDGAIGGAIVTVGGVILWASTR